MYFYSYSNSKNDYLHAEHSEAIRTDTFGNGNKYYLSCPNQYIENRSQRMAFERPEIKWLLWNQS
jgi:hypothetical protein